jgi:hypothetical protein
MGQSIASSREWPAPSVQVFVRGEFVTSRTLAEGVRVSVGRDERCDIVVDDAYASRRQLQLRVHEGRVEITDTDSSYGTRVEGRRVTRETWLRDGATVNFGKTEIVVICPALRSGVPTRTPPQSSRRARLGGQDGKTSAALQQVRESVGGDLSLVTAEEVVRRVAENLGVAERTARRHLDRLVARLKPPQDWAWGARKYEWAARRLAGER